MQRKWKRYRSMSGITRIVVCGLALGVVCTSGFASHRVLDFEGTTHVDFGDNPEFEFEEGESYTVELWLRSLQTVGSNNAFLHNHYGAENEDVDGWGLVEQRPWYMISQEADNQELRFLIRNDEGDTFVAYSGSPINPEAHGEWLHCAGVYDADAGEIRLYVDGTLTDSTDADPAAYGTNGGPLVIGGTFLERAIEAQMGELRLWNTVRSEEDIENSMDRRLAGNEEGLIGYWPLNEGSGDTAYDLSPHENHGAIEGATWVSAEDLPIVPFTDVDPETSVVVAPEEETQLGPILLHEDYEADATFQWYFEGEELEGETGPGLFIDDATEQDAGTYTVVGNHPDFTYPIAEYDILVRVFEAQAPAAGVVGLGMLTLALAGGAAYGIRRMRR